MGISYKLEHFEGPLDLLLHLIEKNKVSIYDIPIVTITEQYLDYVNRMDTQDLELVSEFLVMASTLLDIKAKMLLPKEEKAEEEEEDPRAELVRRLLEYKMYRFMARELEDMEEGAERFLFKAPTVPKEVAEYEPPVDLDSLLDGLTLARLQEIFESVLKRNENKKDPVRSSFGTIKKEPVSLEEKLESVLSFVKKRRRACFREMLGGSFDRMEIVVTFLAVLELMKLGKISLTQESIDDDMILEALEPAGENRGADVEGRGGEANPMGYGGGTELRKYEGGTGAQPYGGQPDGDDKAGGTGRQREDAGEAGWEKDR